MDERSNQLNAAVNGSAVVEAIHRLEISVMQRLSDQASQLRERVEDNERRHGLELKALELAAWQRFEQFKIELYARIDGQRSDDMKHFLWRIAMVVVSICLAAVGFLYTRIT